MGVMAGQDRTRVISQTVVLGWTSEWRDGPAGTHSAWRKDPLIGSV
jgi:hypothetical protein